MIPTVVDASVLVELLTKSPRGERALDDLHDAAGALHVPHLADVEAISVLRGLVAGGVLTPARSEQALIDLRDFPARRWAAPLLFERIWELRHAVTAYDATYIALAEALGARLITADDKLARGASVLAACDVVVVR